MRTPIIPVACFVLVLWGFVLLMQGTLRRDPTSTGFAEAQQWVSDDYSGMRHPPERHPWRLVAIGAAMVTTGIALIVVWGSIWG